MFRKQACEMKLCCRKMEDWVKLNFASLSNAKYTSFVNIFCQKGSFNAKFCPKVK